MMEIEECIKVKKNQNWDFPLFQTYQQHSHSVTFMRNFYLITCQTEGLDELNFKKHAFSYHFDI